MSGIDPARISREQLFAPHVDAADLAQVAAVRPDLWPDILRHPHIYPGLHDWIQQRSPTQSEGWQGQNGNSPNQHVQQMSDGARQVASGARDFFNSTVSPTATNAGGSIQGATTKWTDQSQAIVGSQLWPIFTAAGAGILAFVCLFLPAGSVFTQYSVNLFHRGIGGPAWLSTAFIILLLAAAVVAFLTKRHRTLLILSVASAAAGIAGVISSIIGMANVSQYGDSSVGVGSILLIVVSAGLIVIGVVGFVRSRRKSQPRFLVNDGGAAQRGNISGFAPNARPHWEPPQQNHSSWGADNGQFGPIDQGSAGAPYSSTPEQWPSNGNQQEPPRTDD